MTRPGPATRGRPAGASGAAGGAPATAGARTPGTRGRRRGGPPPRGRFSSPYQIVQLRAPDGPLRARLDLQPPRERGMTFASRSGRPPRGGGGLRRFVRAYGWRAYALPVLTVLTVLCGVDVANGSSAGLPLPLGGGGSGSRDAAGGPTLPTAPTGSGVAQPDPRPTSTRIYVDDGDGDGGGGPMPSTALPPGGPYSKTGGGRFDVVPGTSKVYGAGPLRRFTVEVEAGVAEDGPTFATAVEQILGGPRSWGAGDRMSFQRVDGGAVDFRVSLTASMTVRTLCGYTLPFETSCYNGELGRAVINDARWVRGAVAYGRNLSAYRTYVINHEVGHALGHDHQQCPKAGAPAPVMVQQTLGVGRCKPNPYPFP